LIVFFVTVFVKMQIGAINIARIITAQTARWNFAKNNSKREKSWCIDAFVKERK